MAQERKNPGGGQQTPQFEERSLRKPKQLEFTRQSEEKTAAKRESFGDMQRVFLKKSAED